MINWNKLKIEPTENMTDTDVKDFVEWVCKKAERLGFKVELDMYKEKEASSSEFISPNPLVDDETN